MKVANTPGDAARLPAEWRESAAKLDKGFGPGNAIIACERRARADELEAAIDSRSVIARIEQLKAERDAEVTAYTEENVADDLRAAWRELNPADADELDALLARRQPTTPATVTDEDVERALKIYWKDAKGIPSMQLAKEYRDMRAALESFANKETTDE